MGHSVEAATKRMLLAGRCECSAGRLFSPFIAEMMMDSVKASTLHPESWGTPGEYFAAQSTLLGWAALMPMGSAFDHEEREAIREALAPKKPGTCIRREFTDYADAAAVITLAVDEFRKAFDRVVEEVKIPGSMQEASSARQD